MTLFLSQQTPTADELYDIVVLEPVPPIWPLVFWSILGVLLFTIIAVAIWYFLKDKREGSGKSAATTVRSRLLAIEKKRGDLDSNQFSLAISDALKDYLAEKFDDPVRFETSQEFLKRNSDSSSKLPVSAQAPLKQFLSESEELKFGSTTGAETKLVPLLKRADEIVVVCEQAGEQKTGE